MKLLLIILFFLTNAVVIKAQSKSKTVAKSTVNLVANGGFQDINTCIEFEALCEPEAWYFIPSYIVEPQTSGTNKFEIISVGNVFLGPRSGNYLYTKLLCPLTKGKQYRFSIWLASPKSEFNHLDVLFRIIEPTSYATMNIIEEPSFSIAAKHADSIKPRWKRYSYIYTADGEEKFMIIGNFNNTPISKKTIASNGAGDILYAIDNIAFTPLDSKEPICAEYDAVVKQLYDQNYRHPARLTDKIPLDSSLVKGYKPRTTGKPATALMINPNDTVEFSYTTRDTIIIPDILFNFNSSKLNPTFENRLEVVLNAIKNRSYKKIEITGHTDNVGSNAFNEQLSLERATSISKYLQMKLGIEESKLEVRGLGETQPIDNNHTGIGRKRNRRVVIILKD